MKAKLPWWVPWRTMYSLVYHAQALHDQGNHGLALWFHNCHRAQYQIWRKGDRS